MTEALPVLQELIGRIGQTNAAKRIGVAVDTISARRLSAKLTVKRAIYDAAVAALEDARAKGEDGWDIQAARAANLTPEARQLGIRRSAEVRRQRAAQKDKREERRRRKLVIKAELAKREAATEEWKRQDREAELLELAMDAAYCQSRWAYDAIEAGWPLADFECKHNRLPSDRTPPCGCWPSEA